MLIEAARPSDIETIADHLGRTFAADPSIGWILRKAADPAALTTAYYRIVTERVLEVGHIDVAREGEAYLGCAVWLPPGVELPEPSPAQALALFGQAKGARLLLLRYLKAISRVRMPFPAWYLAVIAVNDAARGKGVGSALLDMGLERCGTHPIKLEATSMRSAKLYESRGFIHLGELATPAPTPEYYMWRPRLKP
ncbi:GNAT family N-acetyltransferase [Flaviflexus huanghaiensis]|uniref:GNAT family N-acetyltransferase n=1 Tax=Flaviflexus huanghaiensis TaxID=1111473 RepID=UPI0015F9BF30|nr:GNAT family N-acetyltransferase [Flaviflexus huanghaiensis]